MGLDATYTLNNGVKIPRLGLGLYQSKTGDEARKAVEAAFELGYRHFDSAAIYGNEGDLGAVLKDVTLPREEVFVTTKLWNDEHGYDKALKAFEVSRKALGLEFIDLYLIHWPVETLRHESWRALETLLADGRCRAIGVSNYTVDHLKQLKERSDIVPAVNQVEFSPFLYQKDLLEYCQGEGIMVEAYSPLTRAKRLDHEGLCERARAHGKTAAQILIRWILEHGMVVLPKSVRKERIAENSAVFDFKLSEDDMAYLDSLNEDYRTCWNPEKVQ